MALPAPSATGIGHELLDLSLAHKLGLAQLENGVVDGILDKLDEANRDLLERIERRILLDRAQESTRRLQRIRLELQTANLEAYRTLGETLSAELREIAAREAAWTAEALEGVVPLVFSATRPDRSLLHALVTDHPIQGRLMADYVRDLSDNATANLMRAIDNSVASGDTVHRLKQRLRGTRRAFFRDGVLQQHRRHAETWARTAMLHSTEGARQITFEENADLIQGVMAIVTLDHRTCKICQPRDSLVWTLDKHRPIGHDQPWNGGPGRWHWQCRCTRIPVLKTLDALEDAGFDVGRLTAAERASMNGPVPAAMDYQEWLGTQSREVQHRALGAWGRVELFRQGAGLEQAWARSFRVRSAGTAPLDDVLPVDAGIVKLRTAAAQPDVDAATLAELKALDPDGAAEALATATEAASESITDDLFGLDTRQTPSIPWLEQRLATLPDDQPAMRAALEAHIRNSRQFLAAELDELRERGLIRLDVDDLLSISRQDPAAAAALQREAIEAASRQAATMAGRPGMTADALEALIEKGEFVRPGSVLATEMRRQVDELMQRADAIVDTLERAALAGGTPLDAEARDLLAQLAKLSPRRAAEARAEIARSVAARLGISSTDDDLRRVAVWDADVSREVRDALEAAAAEAVEASTSGSAADAAAALEQVIEHSIDGSFMQRSAREALVEIRRQLAAVSKNPPLTGAQLRKSLARDSEDAARIAAAEERLDELYNDVDVHYRRAHAAKVSGDLLGQKEAERDMRAARARATAAKRKLDDMKDDVGVGLDEFHALLRRGKPQGREFNLKLEAFSNPYAEETATVSREMRRNVTEAMRFVSSVWGRRLPRAVLEIVEREGRAGMHRKTLVISSHSQTRALVHEIAHWLEAHDPTVHRRLVAFLDRRTKGQRALPHDGYSIERFRADKFVHHYMGKDYSVDDNWTAGPDRGERYATELLSMGLEMLFDRPRELARDPEMFDLIIDILSGQ